LRLHHLITPVSRGAPLPPIVNTERREWFPAGERGQHRQPRACGLSVGLAVGRGLDLNMVRVSRGMRPAAGGVNIWT
jgi:hypothetical protein